jgi:hypothetical protein
LSICQLPNCLSDNTYQKILKMCQFYSDSSRFFYNQLCFLQPKFFWVVLSFCSWKSFFSSPILFMCPNHLICLSLTACRVGFIFKFSLKVEFLILPCQVFPSIFPRNLISMLCILLFCFGVSCWTICQDWGGHFRNCFDLYFFWYFSFCQNSILYHKE